MLPTRRLLLLLLVAAPFLALGGLGVWLALTVMVLALVSAAVDAWLAGDGQRVRARREVGDALSLASWSAVRIVVENPGARTINALIRDVPPSTFDAEPSPPVVRARIAAGETVEHVYRVRPRQRGDHGFDDLFVRVAGPLGLVARQWRVPHTAASVRVYPGLRDVQRFELQARRGLLLEAGTRAMRVAGASTEFERVRERLPDDELRRMNWKATARRGAPMVNQLQAERSQNVVVMLDAGRLMTAQASAPGADEAGRLLEAEDVPGLTKLDHALNAALLISHVAMARGDRIAVLAYADQVRAFVPPARGRRALLSVVQTLYNLRGEPVEPDHARAFDFLAQRNLRRSLVILFTDLIDRESSTTLVQHVLRASRRHQVVVVTLGDPNVRIPAARTPTTSAELYQKMVAQRLLDERAEIIATMSRRAVYWLDTDVDRLSPRLVSTYLEIKSRGRV